jgi:tRNA 2-selenouridine synthase
MDPVSKLDVTSFLMRAEIIPVVDVRSPSEYHAGHIPGAVNIPLFEDKEREVVGIEYKREGKKRAILKGLELMGPAMSGKLKSALSVAGEGKLLVHCWRGGMRSEAMAWLFSLGEIETCILEGGYKAYRNHILESLSEKRKMIILGGFTGSSKTHILEYIRTSGNQVIDLEGIANHKGSAFGALGQPPQPTTEQFGNQLFVKWVQIDPNVPVWLEDESRNIGTVFLHERFHNNMQNAPTIILLLDIQKRLPRLIKEYSNYPPEALKSSIQKISKRLGGDNTTDAIKAVETGDFAKAIEITLNYYDKAYLFGIKKKNPGNIFYVTSDTDDIEENARKVMEAAKKISFPRP